MNNGEPIRRFEHTILSIGQEGFDDYHWKALAEYNEKHGGKFFDLLHNGVRFKEFVGVIQVRNLTIEILPKVDRSNDDKKAWQGILLEMLRECHWMRVHSHEKASLRLKHNSILDAYLEIYLNTCENLLHEGLVKKYRKEESNLFALKGKLKFSQHIRSNLVHEERFFTQHAIYDRNNVYNQILLKALKIIPQFTVSSAIRDKLSRLLLDFPDMFNVEVTAETFQKLTYDRKTERYKEAIEIAAMLLLNYRPDIRGGRNHVLAILFDMNELWEEYFYRRLKKHLGAEWEIQYQPRNEFWVVKGKKQSKSLQPDLVLFHKQKGHIVIDTKWKMPKNDLPSDEDLRQIFAYIEYWKSELGILLYPQPEAAKELTWLEGVYQQRPSSCVVSKVPLLKVDIHGRPYIDKDHFIEPFRKQLEDQPNKLSRHEQVTI